MTSVAEGLEELRRAADADPEVRRARWVMAVVQAEVTRLGVNATVGVTCAAVPTRRVAWAVLPSRRRRNGRAVPGHIVLSSWHVPAGSEAEWLQVARHEAAHVAVGAGRAAHGPCWRRQVVEFGGMPVVASRLTEVSS